LGAHLWQGQPHGAAPTPEILLKYFDLLMFNVLLMSGSLYVFNIGIGNNSSLSAARLQPCQSHSYPKNIFHHEVIEDILTFILIRFCAFE
jgi:hypothetical protein